MKDCIKVHLPDGTVYKMVLRTEKITDADITEIRQLFGKAENLEIGVEVPEMEAKKGLKNRTLVLWGETLAKSYVTVEQY